MRRHRNMTQMREQIKTPEKELNEMEISNLSDAEFKTLDLGRGGKILLDATELYHWVQTA